MTLSSSPRFASLFFRPLMQMIITMVIAFFIGATLLAVTAWRSIERLQPTNNHVSYLIELKQLSDALQDYVDQRPAENNSKSVGEIEAIVDYLTKPPYTEHALTPNSNARLEYVRLALIKHKQTDAGGLLEVRNIIKEVSLDETRAHHLLLASIDRSTRFEFNLSIVVLVILTIFVALLVYLLRNKFISPLNTLSQFMPLLGQQEYKTMPLQNVDPLLLPLFQNYNTMVERLAALEIANNNRQDSLEKNIRNAAGLLLEQHLTLARSERLAAVGEFAATLAHELRNPLAGIQIALTNLLRDITGDDYKLRIQIVTEELARVNRIINNVLDQSRHFPEKPSEFEIGDMIEKTIHLLKYQLPQNIVIQHTGSAHCVLPIDTFRQSLINIVINAAQAIGADGGKIDINVYEEGNYITIQISDNGPGFPAQLLQQAPQLFATWKEKGTGIGLALVRRFVQNVGGELRLKSNTPTGACVVLNLPKYNVTKK